MSDGESRDLSIAGMYIQSRQHLTLQLGIERCATDCLWLQDGRLGLIDYGQVKHIDLPTRLSYARLIVAL